MDLRDSPEEAAFRAEARSWLAANASRIPRRDTPPAPFSAGSEPADVERAKQFQASLADACLAGITWPSEHGGRGGSPVEEAIFDEEALGFDVPNWVFVINLRLAGPTIIRHGSPAQKDRHLRPMLRGEEVWCQLFSEPEAGSDLASLRTRAVRDGDGWLVSGEKVWTSGAHYADWGILIARTDPGLPKRKGLTYFILDMRAPGITVRPIRQLSGDSHFNQVFLDDVRIPDSDVLGEVNDGWAITMTTLMNERQTVASGEISIDPSQVTELARGAVIAGQPAMEDPSVRDALVDLHIRAEILRFLRYRHLTALKHDAVPGPEGSIGKVAIAELLRRSCDLALRLQGQRGLLIDDSAPLGGSWQAMFMAAPAMRIAGGTDEIQRNIIAERVLGLPSEPTRS